MYVFASVYVQTQTHNTDTHTHTNVYLFMHMCLSSAHTTRLNRNIRWQLCALIERQCLCHVMKWKDEPPGRLLGARFAYMVYKQRRV